MNVSDLGAGEDGLIHQIEEEAVAGRLKEFGIFSGTRIRLAGQAPSGCPMMLEAGDIRFALRREQARYIKIVPLD